MEEVPAALTFYRQQSHNHTSISSTAHDSCYEVISLLDTFRTCVLENKGIFTKNVVRLGYCQLLLHSKALPVGQ